MRLNSGEFEAKVEDGEFVISITQESDISLDGGYSFEDSTSSFEISKDNAGRLVEELQCFIEYGV